MMQVVKIGTRESALAMWQAKKVQALLAEQHIKAELVPIKSEGDIDLTTPLYEIGVQGIFTKALDIALLKKQIDLAVHSYKDVPTQLAKGLAAAAVLKRDSYRDILVFKGDKEKLFHNLNIHDGKWQTPGESFTGSTLTIATSSVRRRAQWLNRFPHHTIDNLRGNVNTRLKKLEESNWDGAIFAAAGLERIDIRPEDSIDLSWMLPAPAQGTVVAVCRDEDITLKKICAAFNDSNTALCTGIERDFLRTLMGGCSTPISALAEIKNGQVFFRGNIISPDGRDKIEAERTVIINDAENTGKIAANEMLEKGGNTIIQSIRNGIK
ncbi:hydroxymethylbilane synthase [Terrimonas sp.]|uniref:hydroxymethylbilane synthase n=1 Tax=Terrimonas sp. TaxID=1914338 RepID=UPI000D5119B6|nr:hydroxymethylbilane synthase [Terrimonas sp.]PVD52090.1 hydroxymethylbilane synthase [Terrimonas sp.]